MAWRTTVAITMALLAAGCIGGPGEQTDAPVEPSAAEGIEVEDIELYSYVGTVIGASAPHPIDQEGPLAEEVPVARVDTFEVGPEVVDLDVEAELAPGLGSARVEIYNPSGQQVYRSDHYDCAGAPGAASVCLIGLTEHAANLVEPGTYEVVYYVAGAMDVEVAITGEVPLEEEG